jgi:hypothetical protein
MMPLDFREREVHVLEIEFIHFFLHTNIFLIPQAPCVLNMLV